MNKEINLYSNSIKTKEESNMKNENNPPNQTKTDQQEQENVSSIESKFPFKNVNEFRAWLDNSDRKLTI